MNIDPDQARHRRSEELARRALALDPNFVDGKLALGRVSANAYDYRRASELFREATRLEPNNFYAWDLLSWTLAYEQPPDGPGAEKAGKEAVRLQPTSFGAYYHLGRAFLVQKKYDEAIEAFRQAKTLNPEFTSADGGLAQVYRAQGRYAEARDLLEAVILRRSTVMTFQLSLSYAGLGQRDKALEILATALKDGYRDFAAVDSAREFEPLRSDRRFQDLLAHYRPAK